MIACQDQGRSAEWEPQKSWYQLAVASIYELGGAVVGGQDLEPYLDREGLVFEVSVAWLLQ